MSFHLRIRKMDKSVILQLFAISPIVEVWKRQAVCPPPPPSRAGADSPTLRARLGPAMVDEDEERFIIEPRRLSSSSSSTPGRVMASLLHSRPKHLEAAIAGVDSGGRRNTERAFYF